MGGRFSRDNRPLLPGAYFNVEAIQQTVIPPSTGQIVAVPIVHTWGPVKTPTLVSSAAQFEAVFGRDLSPGRTAVINAFRGEDVPGWGGAGAVLVYRIVGSAGAKASRTSPDTAGTPATAVTVTARYEGSRGNRLRVGVLDTAGDVHVTDLIVYDGTVELERYTFIDADTQALVTRDQRQSEWITATRQGAGPLTLVTRRRSPHLRQRRRHARLGSDWTSDVRAGDRALRRARALRPDRLRDPRPRSRPGRATSTRAGKRFRHVVGGGTSDSASTAISRTASLQDTTYRRCPSTTRTSSTSAASRSRTPCSAILTSSQLASATRASSRSAARSTRRRQRASAASPGSSPGRRRRRRSQMFKGGVVVGRARLGPDGPDPLRARR
jgi:hypothetical protein